MQHDQHKDSERNTAGSGSDPRRTVEEAVYWMPYERGEEAGERAFDDQHLWGGRVTRKGQAEEAARGFLQAAEDNDLCLEGPDAPDCTGDDLERMLDDLRATYGDGLQAYLDEAGMTEEDLLWDGEGLQDRWRQGCEAGWISAGVASAKAFLGIE